MNSETCRVEDFLTPSNFATCFDNMQSHIKSGYQTKQYQHGLDVGSEFDYIYITLHGSWGAQTTRGKSLTAYETIGLHAHTAALLKGFLDSGCPLVVARWDGKHIKRYIIENGIISELPKNHPAY